MAPVPNTPDTPEDDLESYLGLPQSEAEEHARGRGWTTVRSLAPGTIVTMEFVVGRLNFEVQNDAVTKVWPG